MTLTFTFFGGKESYTLSSRESQILTESSGFLSPQSNAFKDWMQNSSSIDLSEFCPNDMKILVLVLCTETNFITLPSLSSVFKLCSYLLIDESLLIKRTKRAPYKQLETFRLGDVRALFDLMYDCKQIGYNKLGEHIVKLYKVPLDIYQNATSRTHFKKRMSSLRKHHYWYLTRIIPTCICLRCAQFRSVRFMHGWSNDEEEDPNNPYPLGVGAYITIFPHREC
jgi:hypothetical protein